MPRRLLRNGLIVDDDWTYLAELEGVSASDGTAVGSGAASAATTSTDAADAGSAGRASEANVIIPFERWQAERERWLEHRGRLGVVLLPAHKVEALAPDVARFDLIGAEFPGPSDGRGYTQGRLLRERYEFSGELRAMGYVRRDQLFFLARCGFNSFELPENELATASSAFSTFSAEYQPSNDEGLAIRLRHRV